MTAILGKRPAVAGLIDDLAVLGGLGPRDLANILSVSPETVDRWRRGEAGPTVDHQTAMAQLRWIAERLGEFYAPDEVRLWLQSPHPQLASARPYDLVNDNRADAVLEVIERLDSGIYL